MKDFKDIYEMIYVPIWQHTEVRLLLFTIVLIFFLIMVFFVFKKILKKKKITDYSQDALTALRELQASNLLSEHHVELFYVRLTHIIKTYLGARYHCDFAGRTDSEVLSYLNEQIIFPQQLLPLVNDLVSRSQEIKFACGAALIDQMNKDINATSDLIRMTMLEQQK